LSPLANDEAGAVRSGEELDLDALAVFLRDHADMSGVIAVHQFPRGFSNLTYLVEVGDRALVLRRPPKGVAGKGAAHDVVREYRILQALHAAGVAVPKPIAATDDAAVLGTPFYLMERVEGVILRQPSRELAAALNADTMHGLSESFVRTLHAIHSVPRDAAGIAELGKPDGYVERQTAGWIKRWNAARTDDVPAMEHLAEWLVTNRPTEWGAALVHNDYKYDNFVLDAHNLTHICAVLDWEMATVGDPLLDLGTSLGYWLEAGDPKELMALGLGVTALPGNYTRAELWSRYGEIAGRDMPPLTWYYVFGLFKIAVIAQQIYARWKAGLTKDPRFGQLLAAVQLMARVGEAAVQRQG
jgi:aminoglycoside phosphotransferase (APT) family kinase protein